MKWSKNYLNLVICFNNILSYSNTTLFHRVDDTMQDIPITIIDCNEEFVNNPEKHKEMMATVCCCQLYLAILIILSVIVYY